MFFTAPKPNESHFWLHCVCSLVICSLCQSFIVGVAEAAPSHTHTQSDSEPGEVEITCHLILIGVFSGKGIIQARELIRISTNALVFKATLHSSSVGTFWIKTE